MVYSLVFSQTLFPFEVARALTFDPGVRTIIIVSDFPNTTAPVEYFSVRPFLWFNPEVGGLGFRDYFYEYTPMWRNRIALRINFPERWGLEVLRLPNPDNTPERVRAWYE